MQTVLPQPPQQRGPVTQRQAESGHGMAHRHERNFSLGARFGAAQHAHSNSLRIRRHMDQVLVDRCAGRPFQHDPILPAQWACLIEGDHERARREAAGAAQADTNAAPFAP